MVVPVLCGPMCRRRTPACNCRSSATMDLHPRSRRARPERDPGDRPDACMSKRRVMERSLWRTAVLAVRWRNDASRPVYPQMARAVAKGIQLARAVRRPVYDDRTSAGARGKELTVPRSLDRPGQPSVPDQSDAPETPSRLRPTTSQRDLPPTLDRGDQAELADAGRWSKAGLRQRLEHLPPGHPSSLRSDDPESGDARDLKQPEDARISSRETDAIKQNYWSEVPRFSPSLGRPCAQMARRAHRRNRGPHTGPCGILAR